MTPPLPILHAPLLGSDVEGGVGFHRLHTLLELLSSAGVESVSTAGLLGGELLTRKSPTLLLSTAEPSARRLASWANLLAHTGLHSLVLLRSGELGARDRLTSSDLGSLLGLGMVVGSAGVTGRPLIGLSVGELREELIRSREELSAATGYPVHALAPAPDAVGRTFDGLVLREARRAGYTLLFEPGSGLNPLPPTQPLSYRSLRPDDAPYAIRNWVIGSARYRAVGRLRASMDRAEGLARRVRAFMGSGRADG